MREIGIDISGHHSKTSDEFSGQPFDYVLTVGDSAKESCPIFPGKAERIHWSFDDPSTAEGDEASRLAIFRRVRDEIRARLEEFVRGTPKEQLNGTLATMFHEGPFMKHGAACRRLGVYGLGDALKAYPPRLLTRACSMGFVTLLILFVTLVCFVFIFLPHEIAHKDG